MSKEEKDAEAEKNPDKAAMVHGRVEFEVQKRLSAVPILVRFSEYLDGQAALERLEVLPVAEEGRMAAQRWGFNMFKRYRGDRKQNRRMLSGEEMVSVSNGLYALSKLFSGRGTTSDIFSTKVTS